MPSITKVKTPGDFPPEFSLAEMTASSTAKRLGLDNVPKGETLKNLRKTATQLVRVRELLADRKTYSGVYDDAYVIHNPVIVSSGYRSPELNKHIPGSSNTSAHTIGWAADFKCPGFGTPFEVAAKIAASDIMKDVDQLIYEYDSWVHISFDPRNRKQILTINKSGTHTGLHL